MAAPDNVDNANTSSVDRGTNFEAMIAKSEELAAQSMEFQLAMKDLESNEAAHNAMITTFQSFNQHVAQS